MTMISKFSTLAGLISIHFAVLNSLEKGWSGRADFLSLLLSLMLGMRILVLMDAAPIKSFMENR